MKLRYIIAAIAAGLFVFSACEKNTEPVLDGLQVSSSYLSIPVDGGTANLTVNASGSWAFDKVYKIDSGEKDENGKAIMVDAELPAWLSASTLTGGAGETSVVFSADATLDGRTAELRLTCGNETQIINLIQGLSTVSEATCAEVIAGPESKTYRVTGICTGIYNTTYGNWYLEDETGKITIYGTLDDKGNTKNFLSWGLEVGDEVTVEGPKTLYGSTVELVDVTVININKSLIKVESTDPEDCVLPIEGGDLTVNLANKGEGVYIDIPEDAKDWLSIASISGNTVVFHAAENLGGDRGTTLVFRTTDGEKEYSSELAITQKGAILEVSIAEFNAAEDGETYYRLTGVITGVKNASYGNYYLTDWSGTTYVYGTGSKGDFEAAGYKVGDIVTITGQKTTYGETIEVVKSTVENHISVTEVSIEEFLAKEDSKEVYYMVSGTIKEIANTTYGNLYLTDGTNELYVYGCYPGYGASGDNRKNFLETAGIKAGDTLTMIGYKDTYNGTIELCGGIYFSHVSAE